MEALPSNETGGMIQFIKYCIAGGFATVTHVTIFHLFAWKLIPALQANDTFVVFLKLKVPELDDSVRARNSMLANFTAFMFSNFACYLVNSYWVFKPGRHGFWMELGLFYAVSAASLFIGTAMMGYLIKRYGMRTTYAFCANLVSAVLINYAARKFFIFQG